jgi:hypothetical protein
MQVRMVEQVLAPGVQDREKADLSAQVLGIGGDGVQRLAGDAKQQVVDQPLVLVGDGGDGFGQGEHDVEILTVEQIGLALFEPLGTG